MRLRLRLRRATDVRARACPSVDAPLPLRCLSLFAVCAALRWLKVEVVALNPVFRFLPRVCRPRRPAGSLEQSAEPLVRVLVAGIAGNVPHEHVSHFASVLIQMLNLQREDVLQLLLHMLQQPDFERIPQDKALAFVQAAATCKTARDLRDAAEAFSKDVRRRVARSA